MGKKVTIRDIAKELNVSIATVSRALSGKGKVNPELREKIVRRARELGYTFSGVFPLPQPKRVVVLFPTDAFFWDKVEEGVSDAVRSFAPWGIHFEMYRTQGHNLGEQTTILEKLLHGERIDGLAIVPSDLTRLDYFINAFFIRGTRVVTFNVDAPLSKRVFYVGQHGGEAGRMAGRIFQLLLGNRKGVIYTLTTHKQAPSHVMRWQGLTDFVRERGLPYDVSRVVEVKGEEEAYRVVKEELLKEEGLCGIFVSTAFGNCGVGRALKESGKQGIVVVGNDLAKEWETYLEEGIIDCCLYQYPYLQGFLSLVFLVQHLLFGFTLDAPTFYLPTIPIFSGTSSSQSVQQFERLLSRTLLWEAGRTPQTVSVPGGELP
ncbi:substrate-binding domain-containing protein [Candidatus Caldatribacterium saccharofermentans]|uniref:LacI family DNA-binding transcriptional regulator n=1 Tax=Candidatus Caldatribacterium saccharofermentans TaxID=1454753 RepID=A0A7V4WLV9_9BACT